MEGWRGEDRKDRTPDGPCIIYISLTNHSDNVHLNPPSVDDGSDAPGQRSQPRCGSEVCR